MKLPIALILIGLGMPRLIDGVEVAYGLDIRRDVGVLPWYVLVGIGAILAVRSWRLRRSSGADDRQRAGLGRVVVFALLTVLALLVGGSVVSPGLLSAIAASGTPNMRSAFLGLVLVAVGAGLLGAVAGRGRSSSAG